MRRLCTALVLLSLASPAVAAEESFATLADQYWDEYHAHDPAFATEHGLHMYDDRIIDFSAASMQKYAGAQKQWLARFQALDASKLSASEVIDLELVKAKARAAVVDIEEVRRWRRLPRHYMDRALQSVYLIVKRDFAPAPERMKSVIARELLLPKLVAAAKQNLDDLDPINIDLGLEELPANIDFIEKDTVAAFAKVADAKLQKQLRASTAAAVRAFSELRDWLKAQRTRAKGHFAIGANAYAHKLAADEGITEPLDSLLARGEAELARLRAEFIATAKKIDPARAASEVQASLGLDHGKSESILPEVQARLAGLRKFLVDKQLVTIPSPVMPIVQESPPFMRAFTLASMDTPGPYEAKGATEAYFNVTLPDPKWPAAEQESYLRGALSSTIIQMVSIHEAFPGHYVQFLWMPLMRSRTRKIYDCSSNVEGWAHYTEQMLVDEGVAGTDPKLRLAQLQEALLRAARYVVGIRMHTKGMSLAEAKAFFQKEGLQSEKVADMESKRGTEDPTYLYYTWGKLELLRLRDDYKKKLGAQFSLRKFHDALLAEGGIQIPLLRRALLGAP